MHSDARAIVLWKGRINMKAVTTTFAIAILAMLTLVACATGAPVRDVSGATFDRSHDMQTVRTAIVRAGASRGWRMQPQDDGHIIARLDVREHMAEVDIRYDEDSFDITYRDSENLNYDPETGTIHSNYNGWVQNLERDIHNQLVAM
jgi:hypothetical protein